MKVILVDDEQKFINMLAKRLSFLKKRNVGDLDCNFFRGSSHSLV